MKRCIDLFAGLGGFTQAAEQAGHQVVLAANHWQAAVDYHQLNHPGTCHVCQDLQQMDFGMLPRHDVLLASPSCAGHTAARGKDQPQHDAMRATAWAVVTAAEYHRPEFLVVENVPAFLAWSLYPAWKRALELLGYQLRENILDAADFGVPQNRRRVFITGCQGSRPDPVTAPNTPHQAFRTCLDANPAGWNYIDKPGRSAATLARIQHGRREFGTEFLIPYYSSGSGLTGRSLDRPIGTITTRARWAVVQDDRMRMLSTAETCAAMGFPATYRLPASRQLAIHMLGNAVCPAVGEAILRQLS